MPIDTPCDAYANAVPDWQRVRDCVAGERRMRESADLYVRRPMGIETEEEWGRYTGHVPFFGATARTLEGITGLAFYNEPAIVLPSAIAPLLKDVTGDGVPLVSLAQRVFADVLQTQHTGIMVDFPEADPTIRTRRDEERAGRLPRIVHYPAEAVIFWRYQRFGNVTKLAEVRLLEAELIPDGEFDTRVETRIRRLLLDEAQVYRQHVFVQVDGGEKSGGAFVEDPERAAEPRSGSNTLNYIPFWFINPLDQTPSTDSAPLLPLANINVSHFNTSAQLENGLFYTGLPQPYICGAEKADVESDTDDNGSAGLRIGSSNAWVFGDPQTKVEYLEFKGQGLQALERRLDRHEQHMALLGARMLSPDPRGVEAAETAQIHRQGELSAVAKASRSVSAAFADALRVSADWQGAGGKVDFTISVDFLNLTLTADEAVKLMQLWQSGAIAFSDLVAKLKQGQIVRGDRTEDQIVAEIQSGHQPGMPGLTDDVTAEPDDEVTDGA